MSDHRATVREGYDQAAAAYLAARPQASPDILALDHLLQRLAPGSLVLDAGCGAGAPILATLARHHRVVGVDFSTAQLKLAREHVPAAALACQDLTQLGFAAQTFDAVCSYYAVIHIPRELHGEIFAALHRLLKPGGLAFLCLGAEDIASDVDEAYYGVRMYWSHFDAATNLQLLAEAGLAVLWSQIIGDSLGGEAATGGHLFVLAQKGG